MAIIRESGCAFGCHVSHLRELLSFQIFGKSTDDADLDDTAFIDASQHIPEDCCIIDDRLCVGHCCHARDAACGCCLRACVNIFLGFLSGFTEMDMHINESWCDKQAICIINFCAFCICSPANGEDFPIFYDNVAFFMLLSGRIYNDSVFNDQLQCLCPPSVSNTPMPYALLRRFLLLPESRMIHRKPHHIRFLCHGSSGPDG